MLRKQGIYASSVLRKCCWRGSAKSGAAATVSTSNYSSLLVQHDCGAKNDNSSSNSCNNSGNSRRILSPYPGLHGYRQNDYERHRRQLGGVRHASWFGRGGGKEGKEGAGSGAAGANGTGEEAAGSGSSSEGQIMQDPFSTDNPAWGADDGRAEVGATSVSSSVDSIDVGSSSVDGISTSVAGSGAEAAAGITSNVDAAVSTLGSVSPDQLGMWPSELAMRAVEALHVASGLPYWQTVIALTVMLRIALVPMTIAQMRGAAQLAIVKPELEALQKKMQQIQQTRDPEEMAQGKAESLNFFKDRGIPHPFKMLLFPFVQIPVFTGMFFGLRQMGTYFPDWATGGPAMFPDLSAIDSTYILPAATCFSLLALGEFAMDTSASPNPQQAKMMQNMIRIMGVVSVPIAITMPQGIFFYWLPNNILSVMQSITLRQPAIKALADIPVVPPPPPQPSPQEAAKAEASRIAEESRKVREALWKKEQQMQMQKEQQEQEEQQKQQSKGGDGDGGGGGDPPKM